MLCAAPGRNNWDLSFFKNFIFNEQRGTNLQFRAEFFNIWNHPQWVGDTLNGGISTNYAASNFGAVTCARTKQDVFHDVGKAIGATFNEARHLRRFVSLQILRQINVESVDLLGADVAGE